MAAASLRDCSSILRRLGRICGSAPAAQRAEFFGLWTVATRLSAIVGPLTYGVVTLLTAGNHRLAILSTGLFFVAGIVLLTRVDVARGAQAALVELDNKGRRAGSDEAQRLLGTARAALEYRDPGMLLDDLPQRMTDLQRICNHVSEAITQRYFSGATAATWSGGH